MNCCGSILYTTLKYLEISKIKEAIKPYIVDEGDWKDDKPNGKGTQASPDGWKYEGDLKNGKYKFNDSKSTLVSLSSSLICVIV